MTSWKDFCRERNGGDVCDEADACQPCKIAAELHNGFPPLIDLQQERERRRPPGAPSPCKLREASAMVREYALDLMKWSEQQLGAQDTACAELCCFADCIDRLADSLAPAPEGE